LAGELGLTSKSAKAGGSPPPSSQDSKWAGLLDLARPDK